MQQKLCAPYAFRTYHKKSNATLDNGCGIRISHIRPDYSTQSLDKDGQKQALQNEVWVKVRKIIKM